MVNKKVLNIVLPVLLGVLILSGIGALLYYGIIQQTVMSQQVVGKWTWGYIKCEQGSPPVIDNPEIFSFPLAGVTLKDSDFAWTPRFNVIVNVPVQSAFDMKVLHYKICDKSNPSSCKFDVREKIDLGLASNQNWNFRIPFDITSANSLFMRLEDLDSSKCFFSFGDLLSRNECWTEWVEQKGATYNVQYDNYYLVDHNFMKGGAVQLSETCANPKSEADQSSLKLLTKVLPSTLAGAREQFIYGQGKDRLLPNEYLNYISDIVLTVADVEIYNGQEAVCQNKNMVGLSVVSTLNGDFKVVDPAKLNQPVDCCFNDVRIGYHCDAHKWVADAVAPKECSLTLPCPYASKVVNTSDASRTSLSYQTCENNVCVFHSQKVECTNAIACASGQNCVNYKCVDTGAKVGDVLPVVTENGVLENNCAPLYAIGVLTVIPDFACWDWFDWVKGFGSLLIGVLAFVLVFKWLRRKFRSPKDKVLLWVLSLLITLLIFGLAWLFFWIGLITFLVLVIIRIVVLYTTGK